MRRIGERERGTALRSLRAMKSAEREATADGVGSSKRKALISWAMGAVRSSARTADAESAVSVASLDAPQHAEPSSAVSLAQLP